MVYCSLLNDVGSADFNIVLSNEVQAICRWLVFYTHNWVRISWINVRDLWCTIADQKFFRQIMYHPVHGNIISHFWWLMIPNDPKCYYSICYNFHLQKCPIYIYICLNREQVCRFAWGTNFSKQFLLSIGFHAWVPQWILSPAFQQNRLKCKYILPSGL